MTMSQEDERCKRSRLKQIPSKRLSLTHATDQDNQVDLVATTTRRRHGKRRRIEDSGKIKGEDKDKDETKPPFSKADFDRDGYCIVHGVLDAGVITCLDCVLFFVVSLCSALSYLVLLSSSCLVDSRLVLPSIVNPSTTKWVAFIC